MIKNTFSILNGIGEKLERTIWGKGILTWDDFIHADGLLNFSSSSKMSFDNRLSQYSEELNAGNARFFSSSISRREHWRLYHEFRNEAVCLDIETNGLQPGNGGYVTVVGLYDGFEYKCLIQGENLTQDNLQKELSKYKYLITFHGVVFDVPFLIRSFHGIKNLNLPHFDLCYAAHRLGFKGGLKKLEESLGLIRNDDIKGMNGYDAVRLWEQAKRGSSKALDILVKYNKADTINLDSIAEVLYNRLRESTGINGYLSYGIA